MTDFHRNALDSVKKNLLPGRVLEVTHKIPWGFGEIYRQNVLWEDFVRYDFVWFANIILHILLGEGLTDREVEECIRKVKSSGLRILILEHDCNLVRLASILRQYFEFYVVERIDEKNSLFIVTNCLSDASFCKINSENIHAFKRWKNVDLPERDKEVYCLSSEYQSDGRLLTLKDAEFINNLDRDVEIYMVVGGLMFLNLLMEVEFRKIVLFDLSLRQLLFAMSVVSIIVNNADRDSFSEGLKSLEAIDWNMITTLWDREELRKVFLNTVVLKKQWRNLLLVGRWLNSYHRVREFIGSDLIRFHLGGFPEIDIPDGSVIYTSTVDPELWERYDRHHIIEAFSQRDTPELRMHNE